MLEYTLFIYTILFLQNNWLVSQVSKVFLNRSESLQPHCLSVFSLLFNLIQPYTLLNLETFLNQDCLGNSNLFRKEDYIAFLEGSCRACYGLTPTINSGDKMKAHLVAFSNSWYVLFPCKWQLIPSKGKMARRFQELLLFFSSGSETVSSIYCHVVLNVNWNLQCLCLYSYTVKRETNTSSYLKIFHWWGILSLYVWKCIIEEMIF